MPVYEYACQECSHKFDVRHSVNEVPELACPECSGDVRKVFHAAGVIFKGSGWHIKDYAAKSESAPIESAPAKPAEPAASTPTTPSA